MALVVLAAMLRRTTCQEVNRATIASAAFSTTMPCRVSLQNMLNNEDWRFMNDTMMRWCRIRLENRMSTCCSNAEFAKGMADSCSDCVADCVFSKMQGLCDAHFGKACTLTRKPFSKNNISMGVTETFCVPKDCDNAEDLKNNLLVKWFDAQYKSVRKQGWMYDYSDSLDLDCPTMTVTIIVSVIAGIIIILLMVPVAVFLFKAPKERGRVLAGIEDDHHEDEDTPVESLPALPDGTMGSGFGGTK